MFDEAIGHGRRLCSNRFSRLSLTKLRSSFRDRVLSAVVVAICIVAATGGHADASVCRFQPKKSLATRALESAIDSRLAFGLPHGRAYVRRLERNPVARRRGEDYFDFAMTGRELRYFKDRGRVEREAGRVHRVINRIGGLSGGIVIEDDYPTGAFIRVRITRELTSRETRSLRKLARRLRFKRVQFSERYLERLAALIADEFMSDERRLALGIEIWGVGVELDRNAVSVEFSSDRSDSEAVLVARYGPLIQLERLQPITTECEDPSGFWIAPDGITLGVIWGASGSAINARVEVREYPDRVLVGGVNELPHVWTADLAQQSATVVLASPLASRKVYSIVTRNSLTSSHD